MSSDNSILLDNLIFTTVGGDGALAFGAFYKSAAGAAHDADDRIVYDTDNGGLSYDADGSGQVEAIQFARLDANLNLRRRTSRSSNSIAGGALSGAPPGAPTVVTAGFQPTWSDATFSRQVWY